jgi:hypothetical protein
MWPKKIKRKTAAQWHFDTCDVIDEFLKRGVRISIDPGCATYLITATAGEGAGRICYESLVSFVHRTDWQTWELICTAAKRSGQAVYALSLAADSRCGGR